MWAGRSPAVSNAVFDGLLHLLLVRRHLSRGQNQRRIGGGILRLVLVDRCGEEGTSRPCVVAIATRIPVLLSCSRDTYNTLSPVSQTRLKTKVYVKKLARTDLKITHSHTLSLSHSRTLSLTQSHRHTVTLSLSPIHTHTHNLSHTHTSS